MDSNQVYAKTPAGEEAVRQQTRVVQRNLRMVLVQVDGKLTVGELAEKMNNPRLVESALRELAEGGFIAPIDGTAEAARPLGRRAKKVEISALSQFSTFGPKSLGQPSAPDPDSAASNFSSFGKPLLSGGYAHSGESAEPREPAPWRNAERLGQRVSRGKWLVGGLLGLLMLLVGLALFFPYDRLRPGVEASAARLLKTPVRIGHLDLKLLPQPQIELSDVSLGPGADSHIDRVLLSSPLALLGSGQHRIARVRVIGGDFPANGLVALPMFGWPATMETDGVAVGRVEIERTLVRARDLVLKDVSGELVFGGDGALRRAVFEAADRSLHIQATPSAHGVVMAIDAMGWQPVDRGVSFNAMQARGVWQRDKLYVEKLDTNFLGGVLKGNWLLDWSKGLAMAGDGSVSHLDARQVTAAFSPSLQLEGDVDGSFKIRGSGQDWEGLWRNAEVDMDVDVSRGLLRGIDLGEAARQGAGAVARGGTTKFDRLSAEITVAPGRFSGRDVRLNAGMVTAGGQFDADRQGKVDGRVTVHLQTSVSRLDIPLTIGGTLPELSAVGGR